MKTFMKKLANMAEGIVTNVLSTLEKLHDMDVIVLVPALVY